MAIGNLIFVFVAGGGLVLLAILQFSLAARHDHFLSMQPKYETEGAIDARIAERRATLADHDKDLEERRKALQDISRVSADVEEMERRRDELEIEWQQSEERRKEIEDLRSERETAWTDKLSVDGELAEAKSELEQVRERLEKAERLESQIAGLTDEREALSRQVEALRDQVRKLEDAESRVAEMNARAQQLESSANQLEDRIASRQNEADEIRVRIDANRNALAEGEARRNQLNAEVAAADTDLRGKRSASTELDELLSTLEARRAVLEREIDRLEGEASGRPGASDDPLREVKSEPPVISIMKDWAERGFESEGQALLRVTYRFQKLGLQYPARTLRAFHTAMKVNDTTQMAVLAGISGTGKSQLPRQYAAGMGIGFLQVPVQPRWDSPQDLMGFYNYIEGQFRPTDMCRALYALDEQNNESAIRDRMMMVLLDEMNLARVEYYFSDFLSRLENRPNAGRVSDWEARKDSEIELEIPRLENPPRIFPGYNLLFAGTMNEDESTQSLSEKVLDRANLLRFAAPKADDVLRHAGAKSERRPGEADESQLPVSEALSRKVWQQWADGELSPHERAAAEVEIGAMVDLMTRFGRPIGFRLGNAIMAYVAAYPRIEGIGDRVKTALADQIEMRLLPKLRGVELEGMSSAFIDLQEMARRLDDDVLADAIGKSEKAADTTGQFVWHGATRQ